MEIKINNWEKYNPKRDQKTYTWFRVNNDILSGQEFSDFEGHEILVWFSIIAEASKKNSGRVSLKLNYIARCARTTLDLARVALEKLINEGMIAVVDDELHDRTRSQTSTSTTPTYETYETKNTYETNETNDVLVSQDALINSFNKILGGKGRVKKYPGYFLPSNALSDFEITKGFPRFRTIEDWEEIFNEVAKSEYLLGNVKDFVASLPWLVKHDNAIKVLCGSYEHHHKKPESFDLDSIQLEALQ